MRPARRLAPAFALLVVLSTVAGAQGRGRASVVQLRYLGTAVWEISDGATVVLIDPYLSRPRRREAAS